MASKRVLVLRTGSAPPAVCARFGDFDAWFAALLAPVVETVAADAGPGHPLPDLWDVGGVVVTGSLASVTAPAPWMDRLGRWLVDAGARVPVLGVCFGHQLLAHALGGRVERNPCGPEVGTHEVELTDAGRRDPLFDALPLRLAVQQNHEDHVSSPPPGAIVLARNPHSPIQAFAHGPRIRAVQFHPEFDARRNRAFTEGDREPLDAARAGLADEALASIRETPEAATILATWARSYVIGRTS